MSAHTHAPENAHEREHEPVADDDPEYLELPEPEPIGDVRYLKTGDRVRLNGTGKLQRVEFVGYKEKDTLPPESPSVLQYGVEVEGEWSNSVPTAIVHEYSAWTGYETGRLLEREMGREMTLELVEMRL